MEDLSAVSLQHLAQYWPEELRAKLGGLGVASVGEVLTLTPLDVITAPGSGRDVLSAVKCELWDMIHWPERCACPARRHQITAHHSRLPLSCAGFGS